MNQAVTCPYCNALLTVPDPPPGPKFDCPRCGEPFPVRFEADQGTRGPGDQGNERPATVPVPLSVSRTAAARKSLLRTLLVVLTTGAAGLALGLLTLLFRPTSHPAGPADGPARPNALPPAEWEGLRWLPEGLDLVAGLSAVRGLETPAGRDLAARLGLVGETAVGLPAEDIDHVAFGVNLDAALPPPAWLVVVTRRPYDAETLRDRLRASGQPEKKDGKLIDRVRPRRFGDRPMSLWCATDRVFVLGFGERDADSLPARPAADLFRLPKPLAATLRERLPADAVAWAAGHTPTGLPPGVAVMLAFAGLPEAEQKALAALTDLALAARPGEPATAVVALRAGGDMATADAGEALRRRLRGWDWADEGKVADGWFSGSATVPAGRAGDALGGAGK
jgi:hypothetical protein